MNILFVHMNFPAQYRPIAGKLAADPNHRVAAIGSAIATDLPGVVLKRYRLAPQDVSRTHVFARRFDHECRRAEQVLYAANALVADGFVPDIIMVHSGWGENLLLRGVFPQARIIVYCEFYYGGAGRDIDFDAEFPAFTLDQRAALTLKNASQLLGLIDADCGLSPTAWQRSTFPAELQGKISVIHEGIDTALAAPDSAATFTLPSGRVLRKGDEIITYVARNLEPLRGYHVVMRALTRVLQERPGAEVLIVGGEGTPYGAPPPLGLSWRQQILNEVGTALDGTRVHFLGRVPYERHLEILQLSAVHLYFTYPFVLSWSCLEAMSTGCTIVASDVAPVREVLDETCGLLAPFHDPVRIAEQVIAVLADPAAFAPLGRAARAVVYWGATTGTASRCRRSKR